MSDSSDGGAAASTTGSPSQSDTDTTVPAAGLTTQRPSIRETILLNGIVQVLQDKMSRGQIKQLLPSLLTGLRNGNELANRLDVEQMLKEKTK